MFKIAKIEACAVAIPLKMPIKMSGILIETCDNLIVKVTDTEGNVGWGEASSAPTMTGETVEGLVAATNFMAQFGGRWRRLDLGRSLLLLLLVASAEGAVATSTATDAPAGNVLVVYVTCLDRLWIGANATAVDCTAVSARWNL